jgi:hypothetical protein
MDDAKIDNLINKLLSKWKESRLKRKNSQFFSNLKKFFFEMAFYESLFCYLILN